MSDVYLVRNDIGLLPAAGVTGSADSDFPVTNAVVGSRANLYKKPDATTNSINCTYDSGSTTTTAPDIAIVARADMSFKISEATSLTFGIEGANDSGFTVDYISDTDSIAESDLVGPESEDAVFNAPSGLAARQYWRVGVTYVPSVMRKGECSKIYAGYKFDMGRNPVQPVQTSVIQQRLFDRLQKKRFILIWRGITAAKVQTFIDDFWEKRLSEQIFIYDPSDLIFHGDKLIHCRLEAANTTPDHDGVWTVTAQFREL
jgi:hypothetical protein